VTELDGSRVVVVGASSGIGWAVAEMAGRCGAQVLALSRTGSVLKGSVNAAVEATGRHLAKELAPRRINVVSPGVTDTGRWGAAGSAQRNESLARVAAQLPVRRIGSPEDVARAYLLAMTNPSMTGTVLDVDGGALL
jgi:NAD(P)-dependent dehydrogenase (short-subunit alcohol dehydrogenase family)